MKSRRLLTALVGIVVSVVALWLSSREVNPEEVKAAFKLVHIEPLIATLIPGSLAFCLMAWRSKLMFAPVAEYRFIDHLRAHMVGYVGNTLLPFRVGELLRVDYLARLGKVRHSACLGGLVVGRLMDLAFMLVCFLASIPLTMGAISATTGVIGMGVVSALGLSGLAFISRRPETALNLLTGLFSIFGARVQGFARPKLEAFVSGLAALRTMRGVLAVGAITLLRWSVTYVTISLWLMAFDLELAWYAPIVLLASLAFGTALPAAAAFIGTFHYALSTGLGLLGVGAALAISVAIVAHAFTTVPYMVMGMVVVAFEIRAGRFSLAPNRQTIDA